MNRLVLSVGLLFTGIIFGQSHTIDGRVYLDSNKNMVYDAAEKPLAGILISNGKHIVATDNEGRYTIEVLKNNPVFIIKPKGYISKRNEQNTIEFYHRYEETSKEKEFDFPLYPNHEPDTVKIALLGDTQVDVIDDIHHVGKLVTEELVKNSPDIIIPLGDLSFDNLEIFEPLSETLGLTGVPVYYVIGNHDLDFGEPMLSDRDRTFESNFGPSYYAFEYGSNLLLVLNNNYPVNDKEYIGRFDEDQLDFIAGIAGYYASKYSSIKVFTHIPLEFTTNREAFIKLMNPFDNVFVAAGHTHTQYHTYFERKGKTAIHQLVGGAVCGAWWQGAHNIYGIPFAMMYDGTPKGYWFMDANDRTYELRYKVSGAAADKQMHIWVPEHKDWDKEMNILNEPYVYANVFAGNSRTDVELSFNGTVWHKMDYYEGIAPELKRFYLLQELGRYKGMKISKMPEPTTESKHLWRYKIPEQLQPGTYLVRVRATNTALNIKTEEVRVYRR